MYEGSSRGDRIRSSFVSVINIGSSNVAQDCVTPALNSGTPSKANPPAPLRVTISGPN